MDNKALARSFLDTLWNAKDPDAAARMLAADYIEHNPSAAEPGVSGFLGIARAVLAEYPAVSLTFHRIIAEGDMVVAHVHWKTGPADLGYAAADFFRCSDGLIVEHWDVIQAVPVPGSDGEQWSAGVAATNPNGMF